MYEYKAKVNRVVDGDTIDMDIDLGFNIWMKNERVRLSGIDAPESRTRDLEEKAHGLLAKEFIKDKLPPQSEVIVRTELDRKGKFGRVLGEILLDETDDDGVQLRLNKVLVENHLAVYYHGQSKEDIKQAHIENRNILVEKGKL